MSTPRPPRPDRPKAPPIPQYLVDAYFDHELDEGTRERLYRSMLADPRQAGLMQRMQRAIGRLRESVDAPDLTGSIMARVEARRPFLPNRQRRMVSAGRLAAAACVLIAVSGVALTRRWWPGALDLVTRERPVSAVVDAGRADAESGARNLAATLSAVSEHAEPMLDLRRRVLEGVTAGGSRFPEPARASAAPLSPGRLASVWTLPAGPAEPLVVVSGSGAEFGLAHSDLASLEQFDASRFPIARIVAAMGGEWVWTGGPGTESCDRLFVVPGVAAVRTDAPGVGLSSGAVDQSGGGSPR
jgi:hypothetical protein